MSSHQKLVRRLKAKPKDFRWTEMTRLLSQLGYEEFEGRGSRKCFRGKGLPQIRLHEPHPQSTMKHYAVKDVCKLLEEAGLI